MFRWTTSPSTITGHGGFPNPPLPQKFPPNRTIPTANDFPYPAPHAHGPDTTLLAQQTAQGVAPREAPDGEYQGEGMWRELKEYKGQLSTGLSQLLNPQQHPSYRHLLQRVIDTRHSRDFRASELWDLAKRLFFEARDRYGIPAGGMMWDNHAEARYQRYCELCAAAADLCFLGLFTKSVTKHDDDQKIMNAILPRLPTRLEPFRSMLIEDWQRRANLSSLEALQADVVLARYAPQDGRDLSTLPPEKPRPPPYDFTQTLKAHWAPSADAPYLGFLLSEVPFDGLVEHLMNPIRLEFACPLFDGLVGVALHCIARAGADGLQPAWPALKETAQRLLYLSLFLTCVPNAEPLLGQWLGLLPEGPPSGLEHTGARLWNIWAGADHPALQAVRQLVLQRYARALK